MEIHNYSQAPRGDDSYIAEFSIYFPQIDWWIHKCKLRQNKKGGLYVALRKYMTKDDTGKENYHPLTHPGEKSQKEFQRYCVDALKPYQNLGKK